MEYTLQNISDKIKAAKAENKKIVFTNGCFDIIHRGHIAYLTEAKLLGNFLIVGVNSDESVKKLKGPQRPVNNENDRAFVMNSLKPVDAVVIFNEDTPFEIIKEIKPDILVKGGDWKVEDIVGSDIVLANGGEVKSLKFIKDYSTTALLEKIHSL
ncbi:D-glycero-beta-D-manno-heptose 1-phosphate adenylyltransferase [soil metagenome]